MRYLVIVFFLVLSCTTKPKDPIDRMEARREELMVKIKELYTEAKKYPKPADTADLATDTSTYMKYAMQAALLARERDSLEVEIEKLKR
jgi:hypothetical protein